MARNAKVWLRWALTKWGCVRLWAVERSHYAKIRSLNLAGGLFNKLVPLCQQLWQVNEHHLEVLFHSEILALL